MSSGKQTGTFETEEQRRSREGIQGSSTQGMGLGSQGISGQGLSGQGQGLIG